MVTTAGVLILSRNTRIVKERGTCAPPGQTLVALAIFVLRKSLNVLIPSVKENAGCPCDSKCPDGIDTMFCEYCGGNKNGKYTGVDVLHPKPSLENVFDPWRLAFGSERKIQRLRLYRPVE